MIRLTDKRYLPALTGVIGSSLAQAAVIVLTAVTVRYVFDSVLTGASGTTLPWRPLVGLVVLALCGAGAVWLFRVSAYRLGNSYVHELRLLMFDGLAQEARTRDTGERSAPGIQVVRFSNDLNAIRLWISMGWARGLSASLFLAGVLAAMALLYPPIAVPVGVVLVASVVFAWWLGERLEDVVSETRRKRGWLAVRVSEVVGHLDQLLLFGRVGRERVRLERASERLLQSLHSRALLTGALRATLEFSTRGTLVVVIVASSAALYAGRLDAASVVALVSIAGLVGTPVRHLGRVLEYWRAGRVARRMIEPLVQAGLAAATPGQVPGKSIGQIRIRAIEARTLKFDHTLQIQPGERVALWAGNGAGKSTLLALMAGQLRPERGIVRVDGVDPASMDLAARARLIGMASAGQSLLRGSLSKNVRMRIAGASPKAVQEACSAAGLDELLERLPEGLRTRVGPRGAQLSSGEQARVKLAWALLGRPRILLLDEIESGLDEHGMRHLDAVLASYPGTVVFATHDHRLLRHADRVWMLHGGSCLEQSIHSIEEAVGQ